MHILNKILSRNTSYQTWLKVLKCISQHWIQSAITVIIADIILVFMKAFYMQVAKIIYKMILTLMLFLSVNLSPTITKVFNQWSKINNIHIYQPDLLTSKQLVVLVFSFYFETFLAKSQNNKHCTPWRF